MPRIQGLTEFFITASQLIKTGDGYLFSVTISFVGSTIGNKIVLRDGLDGTAVALASFVIPTANGTITKEWSNGKAFATGLYISLQGQGEIDVEGTFK